MDRRLHLVVVLRCDVIRIGMIFIRYNAVELAVCRSTQRLAQTVSVMFITVYYLQSACRSWTLLQEKIPKFKSLTCKIAEPPLTIASRMNGVP